MGRGSRYLANLNQLSQGPGSTFTFRREDELRIERHEDTTRLRQLVLEGRDYFELLIILKYNIWEGIDAQFFIGWATSTAPWRDP